MARFLRDDAEGFAELLSSGIGQEPQGRYLHWDSLLRRKPPHGFSHEEWWLACKLARSPGRRNLSFADTQGTRFGFNLPPVLQEALHRIDREATQGPLGRNPILDGDQRDRYIVSSLMEESIRSSQLEGASTTQRVAKELLRSGRSPRDRSERMIYNNFRAMEQVRSIREDRLTPEVLLELQEIATRDTLDDAGGVGRFRRDDDEVAIVAWDHTVLHTPPPASEIEDRLQELCRFANGELDQKEFLHPVASGILLHFMLAWIHPFVDGNGRTARILFYWAVSRAGYELLEFASISRIIHAGPVRYARAFLETETDQNDLTYFLDYHLGIVRRAMDDLLEYLTRKMAEVDEMERVLHARDLPLDLNHRQLALLSHALRNPTHAYTIESHRNSHRVSYLTARADLLRLLDLGLLTKGKRGRVHIFRPVRDMAGVLERHDAG